MHVQAMQGPAHPTESDSHEPSNWHLSSTVLEGPRLENPIAQIENPLTGSGFTDTGHSLSVFRSELNQKSGEHGQ
jgi:hypothetical protein